MAELPGVKEAINLPLAGRLDLNLDMAMPNQRNGEANGSLDWTCAGCGDRRRQGEAEDRRATPCWPRASASPGCPWATSRARSPSRRGWASCRACAPVPGRRALHRGRGPPGRSGAATRTWTSTSVQALGRPAEGADKLQLMLQLAESMGKRPDGFYGFRLTGSSTAPAAVDADFALPRRGRAGFGSRAAAAAPPAAPAWRTRQGDAPPGSATTDVRTVDPRSPGANVPRYATQPRPRAPGRTGPDPIRFTRSQKVEREMPSAWAARRRLPPCRRSARDRDSSSEALAGERQHGPAGASRRRGMGSSARRSGPAGVRGVGARALGARRSSSIRRAAPARRRRWRSSLRMAARRMTLRSSRTLPGQSWRRQRGQGRRGSTRAAPSSRASSSRNCWASSGMSPGGSRSGGSTSSKPDSRW